MKMRAAIMVCAVCATLPSKTASAGYAEYLQLNGLDNDAVLEDNGNPSDNIVQLRSTNGTFATIQFEMPTDVLAISLGAGNDNLQIEGLDLGTLTAELMVFGQSGDDSVNVRGLDTLADVYSDDVQGNNSFATQYGLISGDVHVTDGSGNQSVILRGEFGGNVYVQSSDGDSTVAVGQATVSGLAAYVRGSVLVDNAGYGNDDMTISGFVDGDVYVDSGHGDFDLSSIFSNVGSLYTNVDSGTSTVFLGDFSSSGETNLQCAEGETNLQIYFSYLNGGLNVKNGLGFDQARIEGAHIPQVNIDNGGGGSSTILRDRFRSLNLPSVQVTNAFGSDTFELALGDRETTTVGSFSASNGSGNSSVMISGTSPMNSVTLGSRNGLDVLSLNGVNIDNNLIAFYDNGGADIDIRDSNIGGSIDIDTKNNTDCVSFFDCTVGGTTNVHTGGGDDTVTVSNNVFSSDFVANGGVGGYDIFATTNDSSFGGIEYVTQFEFVYEY